MSWNDAYERRKFKENQKKQAAEYRALGMTEEQIQAMYEFDLEQFRSDRRFYSHTQPLTASDFVEGKEDESESTLLLKFFDELTVTIDNCGEKSRYWWVDEIGDDDLLSGVKYLTQQQIEILTLIVFENYSQKEAAEKMGIPYRSFKRKIQEIKLFLINF